MTRRTLLRPLGGLSATMVMVATVVGVSSVGAGPIEDQRARVQAITDQLEKLEEQTAVLGEQADVAVAEYDGLVADVAEAEEAVAAQQTAVDELRGELGTMAVRAYMSAGTGGSGPFFASTGTLTDEVQREALSRVALSSGTATSDDLEQALGELADRQHELEGRRDAAADKLEELEEAKAAAEARQAEYREARAEAEEELGNLIREEEERRARESYERMQREAAEAAARQQAEQERAQQQSASPSRSAAETASGSSRSQAPAAPAAPAPQRTAAPQAPAKPAPAPASGGAPAASSQAGVAVAAALSQQGVPWVFAKAEPGVAFDCSGLTSWAWGRAGVYMPHQSAQQYATLPHVSASAAQPGDLVFFYSPISHVGMYIGNGQMVHSPNSGSVVHIRSVNWSRVVGVARPG